MEVILEVHSRMSEYVIMKRFYIARYLGSPNAPGIEVRDTGV